MYCEGGSPVTLAARVSAVQHRIFNQRIKGDRGEAQAHPHPSSPGFAIIHVCCPISLLCYIRDLPPVFSAQLIWIVSVSSSPSPLNTLADGSVPVSAFQCADKYCPLPVTAVLAATRRQRRRRAAGGSCHGPVDGQLAAAATDTQLLTGLDQNSHSVTEIKLMPAWGWHRWHPMGRRPGSQATQTRHIVTL
jgi:hypothetical protein